MIYPLFDLPPLVTIHTFSLECLGPCLQANNRVATSWVSAAYPAANRALYIPFHLMQPITVRKLFVYNGATAAGNIDIGILDSAGTLQCSAGSTAQAGTSVLQEFDITDKLIGPGDFYFGVSKDDAVGTLFDNAPGFQVLRTVGMAQEASAFPLPATATFAQIATAFVPIVGLSTRATI